MSSLQHTSKPAVHARIGRRAAAAIALMAVVAALLIVAFSDNSPQSPSANTQPSKLSAGERVRQLQSVNGERYSLNQLRSEPRVTPAHGPYEQKLQALDRRR